VLGHSTSINPLPSYVVGCGHPCKKVIPCTGGNEDTSTRHDLAAKCWFMPLPLILSAILVVAFHISCPFSVYLSRLANHSYYAQLYGVHDANTTTSNDVETGGKKSSQEKDGCWAGGSAADSSSPLAQAGDRLQNKRRPEDRRRKRLCHLVAEMVKTEPSRRGPCLVLAGGRGWLVRDV
jgi:hypothetical protein